MLHPASSLMGDLGQVTSFWASVSRFTKQDFRVRVLGCGWAAHLRDSDPVPPPGCGCPGSRGGGRRRAWLHCGRAAPSPQGSAAREGHSFLSLFTEAGFKPRLLALDKSLSGEAPLWGSHPSGTAPAQAPSRVTTEGAGSSHPSCLHGDGQGAELGF